MATNMFASACRSAKSALEQAACTRTTSPKATQLVSNSVDTNVTTFRIQFADTLLSVLPVESLVCVEVSASLTTIRQCMERMRSNTNATAVDNRQNRVHNLRQKFLLVRRRHALLLLSWWWWRALHPLTQVRTKCVARNTCRRSDFCVRQAATLKL